MVFAIIILRFEQFSSDISKLRFEDLEVWKKSAALCSDIYKNAYNFRDINFKGQITRSALSISSNIAEGFERESDRECIRFLFYAKGSCGELRSQIYIGIKIGYIEKQMGFKWIEQATEISYMICSLIKTKKRFIILKS